MSERLILADALAESVFAQAKLAPENVRRENGRVTSAAFAPEAIENTLEVAEKCNLEIEMGRVPMPAVDLPDGKTPYTHSQDSATCPAPPGELERKPDQIWTNLGLSRWFAPCVTSGTSDHFPLIAELRGS